MKFPIALQLYTVRDNLEKNFRKTIELIKKQGYDGVELAGNYGLSAKDLKNCFSDFGLLPISAHVPIEEFSESIEKTLYYYKEIGCEYIAIPYLQEEYRYGTSFYNKILEQISKIGAVCKQMDLQLLYHNHDFEFEKTAQNIYVLDELFKSFSLEELQTELDTCWIAAAGENPISYIEKYKSRCPIIHLKDFIKEKEVILKPLGQGIQDFKGILNASQKCGVKWLVVEQDFHYGIDPLENSKISIEYLKKEELV